MRPTVEELLRGSSRILEDVIAPEISSSYASEMLRGVIKSLRVIEQSWTRVLPFLHWDNAAAQLLLTEAKPAVSILLAERIDRLLGATPPEAADFAAVQTRNDELRALLCEVIAAIGQCDEGRRQKLNENIRAHLENRARRFPLRLVPDMPRASPPRGPAGC